MCYFSVYSSISSVFICTTTIVEIMVYQVLCNATVMHCCAKIQVDAWVYDVHTLWRPLRVAPTKTLYKRITRYVLVATNLLGIEE